MRDFWNLSTRLRELITEKGTTIGKFGHYAIQKNLNFHLNGTQSLSREPYRRLLGQFPIAGLGKGERTMSERRRAGKMERSA